MKLHIGCGERYLPGWKHLDARKFPHVDYVTDTLDKLDMFADNSIAEIYACHILEHFTRNEVFYGGGGVKRMASRLGNGRLVVDSRAEF